MNEATHGEWVVQEREPQKKPGRTPKLRARKRKLPRRRLPKGGLAREAAGKQEGCAAWKQRRGVSLALADGREGLGRGQRVQGLVIRSLVRGERFSRVAGQAGQVACHG